MESLRNQVINEHYRLIQQLESKYTEQINQLLKQKALVHLVLQQSLYTKLLEINNISETTLHKTTNTNNSSSPLLFQQQINNANNRMSNVNVHDNTNNNFVQNVDILSCLKNFKDFDLQSNLLLQQLNQTNLQLQNQMLTNQNDHINPITINNNINNNTIANSIASNASNSITNTS
eukprot:487417_1